MAGKGGKRSTTWGKDVKPPTKPKGAKNKTTLLKESMGLTNWDKLASFIKNEGAEKLVDEMSALSGKDFIVAYSSLAEFVKPKLNRTALTDGEGNPLQFNLTIKPANGCEPMKSDNQ